jgi:hypothetical protein
MFQRTAPRNLLLCSVLAFFQVSAEQPQPQDDVPKGTAEGTIPEEKDVLDDQVDLTLEKGEPKILLYASFDDGLDALNRQTVIRPSDRGSSASFAGLVGKARVVSGLGYPKRFSLNPQRGSVHLLFRKPDDGWKGGSGHQFVFAFETYDAKRQAPIYWGGLQIASSEYAALRASNDWHQMVHAWDGDRAVSELYVDGELRGKIPPFEGMAYNQIPDTLVGDLALGVNVSCLLDELYVWDRAISAEEVSAAWKRVKQGQTAWPQALIPNPPRTLHESINLAPLAAAPRPPLPKEVDWSEAGAAAERTTTRSRVCLNGYWRYQPVAAGASPVPDQWLYVRVPGAWGTSPLFEVHDAQWKPLTSVSATTGETKRQWNGKNLGDFPSSFLERDFDAPAEWKGKLVLLQLRGLDYVAQKAVYVNHQPVLDSLDDTTLTVDITKHVRFGETNRLLLYTHLHHSLRRDVWLDVRNEGSVVLEDAFFMPSVRTKTLGLRLWLWNLSQAPQPFQVALSLSPARGSETAKSFPGQGLTLAPQERATREVRFSWPDPHFWHPEDPFLYRAVVRLERDGQVLDESYPERFGFREFWIRDGTFMLNEHPFHVRMYSNDGLWKSEGDDLEWYRSASGHFAGSKALNVNCQRLWARPISEAPYNLADEAGQLMAPFNGQPTRASAGLKDRSRKEVAFSFMDGYVQGKYRARSFLHEFKNHPSLCFVFYDSGSSDCWVAGANYAANLTEAFTEECLRDRPGMREQANFVQHVVNWFQEADPTRPPISFVSGLLGLARSCLSYYNFSQPMQEWQEQWTPCANENKRPMFNTEFCIVFPHMFYSQSVQENVIRQLGFDTILVEQCATYFGDRSYLQEPESYHKGLNRVWKGVRSFESGGESGFGENTVGYWELKRFFARYLEQSYRYLRVNQGFHVEVDRAFIVTGAKAVARTFTLRSPGFISDAQRSADAVLVAQDKPEVRFQNHGEAWSKHTSPAQCFIGGPFRGDKADFSLKDHAFFAGETIEKAVHAINDHLEPLTAEMRWSLMERGGEQVLQTGAVSIAVPPGERKEFNFSLRAPNVEKKTLYLLRLEAERSNHPIPPDEFVLEVFPQPKRLELPAVRISLFDPEGDTAKMLEKAGLTFTRLSEGANLKDCDLLIIGRKAMNAEGRKALNALELSAHVARGMNCLVFEQRMFPVGPEEKKRDFELCLPDQPDRMESSLLGFRADDRRSRYVFVRTPDHPILAGLTDEDFANWRGSTDIEEPYPKPPPAIQLAHKGLKRFPRWSNKGIVSFYQVEKPQVGNFRVLLDCEYDLNLTPLMEFSIGRGTVLLNLLDVTNRYGIDPVATQVVNRMLETIARSGQRQTTGVSYYGHTSYREALDALRLDYRPVESLDELAEGSMLIVGLGKMEKAKAGPPKVETPKAEDVAAKLLQESSKPGEGDIEVDDEEVESALKGKAKPKARPEAEPHLKALNAAKTRIESFVKAGGALLVLPLANEAEASWLPVEVKFEKIEFGLPKPPSGPGLLAGLGVSDFFWRGWRTKQVPVAQVPGVQTTDPPLISVVPCGKGRVVLLSFHPYEVSDSRAIAKIHRIYATILFNSGVSTVFQPDLTVPGYNADKFPYLLRTIAFDPYDHGYY